MKIVVITVPESTNLAAFVKGAEASIVGNGVTLADGNILTSMDIMDSVVPLVPHIHTLGADTGPAIPV